MDLLDFARGPALYFALAVFVLGTLWRFARLWRLPSLPDLSPAREGAPGNLDGAMRSIASGMWPRREFRRSTRFVVLNGYVFHIGLALLFFGYAPHIAFIDRLIGLSWPALPDMVVYIATAATIISLLMALVMRVTDPVRQRISSFDDMLTWAVVFLPVMTGMAVLSEPSAITVARDHAIYRGPLALHLLSLELLLIWFPFGKLMHAFLFPFSRGATGARFSHRGVKV